MDLHIFLQAVIAQDTSEAIRADDPAICSICNKEVSPQIVKPITILCCKHFFHRDCIEGTQPAIETTGSYELRCALCETEAPEHQHGSVQTTETCQSASRNLRSQKHVQDLINELSGPAGSFTSETADNNEQEDHAQTDAMAITAKDLASMCQKAMKAEKNAIASNQKEILCWYKYAEAYEEKILDTVKTSKIAERTARKRANQEIIKHIPHMTLESLRKKNQKARTIYKLFKTVGIAKISNVVSFSANTISILTQQQLKAVMQHFSNGERNEEIE
jgi:hypothetical protein